MSQQPDIEGGVAASLAEADPWYTKIQRWAGKLGVEKKGIERVLGHQRFDIGMFQIATLWISANMVVSSFALGALSHSVFQLGFADAVIVILLVNLLGITPVAFWSTFGPRFGLRQMVLSRYYFGYYGVKLIAIFNVMASIGWSAVNVIVGAQLLNAVSRHLPVYAGVLLISVTTMLTTMFGYRIVHIYETFSWFPCFIIFMIILGVFAHSGDFENIHMGYGAYEAGSALSFAASVFGYAVGWTAYAADYTAYQPVNSPRRSIFIWTFVGLSFPLLFTEMLGAAVATAMIGNDGHNAYKEHYDKHGIGGLLYATIVPKLGGSGKACLIILALSIIANNCPNVYSVSLSLQLLSRMTQLIPRYVWTLLATILYTSIAIAAHASFNTILENFMLMIGYWLAIYTAIASAEHFIFKRGFRGYDIDHYMDRTKLPPGWAAMAAFGLGVTGAILGMAQSMYIGPIGRLCGGEKFGGDVGFELAFIFAFVTYCPLRMWEKRSFGR